MNDKLLKYLGWLPLIAIFIYLFGFLSLNSYLQSFGIYENPALDLKVIKLGVLYSIIVGPVVLFSFSTFKIGNYSNVEPNVSNELINNMFDALGYTIMYILIVSGLMLKYSLDLATCLLIILFLIASVINRFSPSHKHLITVKAFFLIIPFFAIAFCIFKVSIDAKYSFYFLDLGVCISCSSFRIFNKQDKIYQASRITIVITTLLFSTGLFGLKILGNIPVKYGGEQYRPQKFYVDSTDISKINKTDLKYYLKKNNTIIIDVIYETQERYYFKTFNNNILTVPKSYINFEENVIPNKF